jgi:hypothetical protein
MSRKLACIALVALAPLAVAQPSPAKQALVARIVTLQQPSIEGLARNMAEQSVSRIAQVASQIIQAQPSEKRDALAKNVDAEMKKYLDEVTPMLRERAVKAAPGAIGPLLGEKFSEPELKQIATWLESPVSQKYQQVSPELSSALAQKLVADNRASVEPKLKALEERVANVLGVPPRPVPAASAASPSKAKP